MSQTKPNPRILLLSLELQPFFDSQYAFLIDGLSKSCSVQRVKTCKSAIAKLTGDGVEPPAAVLVTDAALANEVSNAPVWDAVLDYVRNGGTAIVTGHFSCFVLPPNVGPFFRKVGLPWDCGDYHRTQTALNRSAVRDMAERLSPEYSQKAFAVKNVASQDIWYAATPDSVTQSIIFASENAYRPGQAAVALARVGEGRLGYSGDTNAANATQAAVLAMCGLL